MKNTLKAALAVAIAAGMVATAQAQDKPQGISIRAGIFFAQGNAKDAEGQNWMTAGIEYKLKDLAYNGNTQTSYSLSLDYYGKGSQSAAPLLLNYIWRTDSFYYAVGAGVAFTHSKFGPTSTSDTEFGYQVSVGKDFVRSKVPFFVEVRYNGNGKTDLNGFAVVGGLRF